MKASKQSGIASFDDVIAKLQDDPNSISIGITPGSADYVNLVLMLQHYGIDSEDVRTVTFTGGGEVRLAVMAGHVDIGLSAATATFSIKDEIVPLTIFSDEPVAGFEDTPLIGTYINDDTAWMPGSQRGWVVESSFAEAHPDRFQILTDAIEKISQDETFLKEMNNQLPGYRWYGPEVSNAVFRQSFNLIEQFDDLLRVK